MRNQVFQDCKFVLLLFWVDALAFERVISVFKVLLCLRYFVLIDLDVRFVALGELYLNVEFCVV